MTPAGARQVDAPKILRTYWDSEFHDMLEPQTTDGSHVDVTRLVYEGLTRLDEELNVVPAAAESWEFNNEGTVISFHLRENLTYSDGTLLTAERFRYAIARICDPHLGSWDAHELFDVVGCQELYESLEAKDGTPVADESGYEAAKAHLGVRAR